MATGASPPHPQIPQPADTPTARRGEAGTALGAGQSDACRALVWPCLATQSNTELLGFYNFLKGLGTIKCSETKVSWLFYFSAGAFPAQDPDKVFATEVCHFSFISSELKPRLTSLTAKDSTSADAVVLHRSPAAPHSRRSDAQTLGTRTSSLQPALEDQGLG